MTDQSKKLQKLQLKALTITQEIIEALDEDSDRNFIPELAIILTGIISTAADLSELKHQGASTYLFKEVESAVKQGGIRNINKLHEEMGSVSYSISDIEPHEFEKGMNYLGQELSTTLTNSIHDLPTTMRKPEMLLRGVEALMANLLYHKFKDLGDVHNILDSLCEHVHMNLNAMDTKVVPIKK